MEERLDMVVGAGPAGEKAAAQAAYFGKRVAVVEAVPALGGAMAASAMTTKAMREAALYLTGFQRRRIYGAGIDLPIDVARSMSDSVEENLARNGIELLAGTARLGPNRTVAVTPARGGPERVLAADVVLIETEGPLSWCTRARRSCTSVGRSTTSYTPRSTRPP